MNKIKVCLRFNQSFQHVFRHFSQQGIVGRSCKVNDEAEKALTFIYPKYESPFAVSMNANYSQWMDRYCTQWAIDNCGPMSQFKKYTSQIARSDCGLFAAATYPGANWHRCEKLMKWSLIFFICDDYHDITVDPTGHEFRTEPFWHQMIEALDSLLEDQPLPDKSWPLFVRAVQQILREIYFDFSPKQTRRSVNMIKDYINGNIKEKQWTQDSLPHWDDYWNARLGSVGGQMALQLIEYAKDIDLEEDQWNHTLIEGLNQLVSEEIILINDYYTFRKEVRENDGKFERMRHPFALLVLNQGMNLQAAVDAVNQMIKDKDQEILRQFEIIENCNELKSKDIIRYVNGVNEFLGGYWRHAVTARRYHGYDFQGVLPLEGRFIYDRTRTVIIPNDNNVYSHQWFKTIPRNVQPTTSI